jgi:hypothetical protein
MGPILPDRVALVLLVGTDTVDSAELAARTGWELKPEGLCKDVRCVPVPAEARDGDRLVASEVARRLGMGLVEDRDHGLIAVGPEAGGHALTDARMPDLVLPDRHGRPFSLRSLRGTRFVMIAWASW